MSRYLPEDELILLYRKTIRPLYGYVSKRVGGDRSLAEDIVQDTWMRALDAWPRKGMPDEPLAWLQHVARNGLASHFRRMRPQPIDPALIDLEDDRFTPNTPDAAALVNWGLARLRRPQVELLEAFHFEGKSVAEIAAEGGISERAVEGRLRRARATLRKKLDRILRRPVESRGRVTTGGDEDARQTRTR
jgi:RNA polymerase sigma-70 factor (ECF subfamily)